MTFAEEWLIKMLSDPDIMNPCPVKALLSAAAARGIKKSELKQARKEAGVVSFSKDGVQYWWYQNQGQR